MNKDPQAELDTLIEQTDEFLQLKGLEILEKLGTVDATLAEIPDAPAEGGFGFAEKKSSASSAIRLLKSLCVLTVTDTMRLTGCSHNILDDPHEELQHKKLLCAFESILEAYRTGTTGGNDPRNRPGDPNKPGNGRWQAFGLGQSIQSDRERAREFDRKCEEAFQTGRHRGRRR